MITPQQKWNRANLKAMAAHQAVLRAKRRGEIIPLPCRICGAPAEAHHEDYERPLAITWLCRFHHRRHHDKQPGDLFAVRGSGPMQGEHKRVDQERGLSPGEPCQKLSAPPSVSAQGRAGPGETMVITGGCEAPALASDSKFFRLRFVWGSR